ncbi:MAG: hypothetical protein IPK57_17595 [Chitinophagaceae bacterium]|nr:hypothetical protein [Chitinophagaceae bacterium]
MEKLQRRTKLQEVLTWTRTGSDHYSNVPGNEDGYWFAYLKASFWLEILNKKDNGTITLNNPGSILQFQNAGVSKSYVQLSGDNLRMGANGGNQFGKTIFRLAGADWGDHRFYR